ncbi:hypothetical protein PA1R_gp5582 [Pseudomonas aeruginosa PA1R]|nr:hypothetical protein PA1R_gp5582 [Pseudomonas aeruginosa PA1R]
MQLHGGGNSFTLRITADGPDPAIGRPVVLRVADNQWGAMQRRVVTGNGGIEIGFGELDLTPPTVQVPTGTEERDAFHGLCAWVVVHGGTAWQPESAEAFNRV